MATIEEIVDALRANPLFIDPELDELDVIGGDDRVRLEDELRNASTPVYVAVVPVDSDIASSARQVADAAGGPGAYLVTETTGGNASVAANGSLPGGRAEDVANRAFSSAGGELAGAISAFATFVDQPPENDSGSGGGSGAGGLVPLGILAVLGGGGFLLYRRNQRAKEIEQLQTVQGALDEDITAYGEAVSAVDLDLRSGAADTESQADYARALDLYEAAKEAAGRAEKPADLQPVTSALEEGRWLLARVDARVHGRDLPDRRPPCFFDPRHGPSVEDVSYAPDGGTVRDVPACQADAVRVRDGRDPDVRMVRDEQGGVSPYWDAGPAYGAWAGGYFSAMLPAMFMGTMMGSAMGGGLGGFGYGGDGGGADGGGFSGGGFGDEERFRDPSEGGGGFDGGGFGDGGGGFDGGGFGGFDF